MKERPILFSAPMVRAILEGRKTQTRRIIKPQPSEEYSAESLCCEHYNPVIVDRHGDMDAGPEIFGVYSTDGEWGVKCPYGQPGDRLWVRETFADLRGMGFGNDPRTDKPWNFAYSADVKPGSFSDETRKDFGVKWKPSIHMPRVASRIALEITGVRVERLQYISNEDIRAEGACNRASVTHRLDFEQLWASINGAGSWGANPWVWVIEFKRI